MAHASMVDTLKDDEGFTDVANRLNAQIKTGDNGVYTGGKGVFVRTPDFFVGDPPAVVPATLWVNDIHTPSGLYPAGDPMCPTSGDGWSGLHTDCSSEIDGSSWNSAIVAVVIGSSMQSFLSDWDGIQSEDWGWGVFYPFDSNSCDGRCAWSEENGGWDCPGGWLTGDGSWFDDASKKGAGSYQPGNPYAGIDSGYHGGGGAGCHVDGHSIDQMEANSDYSVVQDRQCQCNMIFNDNWQHWVENWINNGFQKEGFEWRGWFAGGKAPTWAMDTSGCWVNNIKDMILMQNALYDAANDWNNQMVPQSNWGNGDDQQDRIYWGWNEIPVATKLVEDPKTWDSIIIKLPANICSNYDGMYDTPDCLGSAQKDDLAKQLMSFEKTGQLLTGKSHKSNRPGSYILFVREYKVANGWERLFFCRNYVDKQFQRQVVYDGKDCYYDSLSSSIGVV